MSSTDVHLGEDAGSGHNHCQRSILWGKCWPRAQTGPNHNKSSAPKTSTLCFSLCLSRILMILFAIGMWSSGVDCGSWHRDGRQGGSRSHHWRQQGYCSLQGFLYTLDFYRTIISICLKSTIATMLVHLPGNRGGSVPHVDCVCISAASKHHDYRWWGRNFSRYYYSSFER